MVIAHSTKLKHVYVNLNDRLLLLFTLFIDILTCETYMEINMVIMNLEYLFPKETLMGGAHADSKLR